MKDSIKMGKGKEKGLIFLQMDVNIKDNLIMD